MWQYWTIAALICFGFAALEAMLSGRSPAGTLKSINQPKWAPPFWAWVVIGAVWYGICLLSLARLLPHLLEAPLPFVLLLTLMAANVLWGVILFKAKRYDIAFVALVPYAALLLYFLLAVSSVDRPSLLLFAGYGAYLAYATAWSWSVWQLNPRILQNSS
jgi:translocator protein